MMTLKAFGLTAALLGLLSCNSAPNEGSAKAVTDQPAAAERAQLPLPPFPDLGETISSLADWKPQDSIRHYKTGMVIFPIKSPYDFSRVLNGYDDVPVHAGMGTLLLPKGASADNPVPAMVILHGSGGIQDGREHDYAALFAQNGIASLVVDYYTPRGVSQTTPYVMKTMIATEVDIMSDAYSALKVLGTHPAVDATRIGVTGYSYGGMATRYVLDDRLKNIMAPDVPPFALHMDIYGPCHQTLGHTGTTGAPYLAIHGDNDNSVDPALCQIVYKDLEAGGSAVESHVMPGAGHAWENTKPRANIGAGFVDGCEFSFDPKDGTFLVDGKSSRFQPEPDMTRAQRAYVRSTLGELAGTCVGQGYLVGSDPETDKKSKALQLDFMKRVFGL